MKHLRLRMASEKNFELGFYTFTAFSPKGDFQYLGNQIRPRVTAPLEWKWPFGASLSLEAGFFRPHKDSSFNWQGELRPIIDKNIGNLYVSLNRKVKEAGHEFIRYGNIARCLIRYMNLMTLVMQPLKSSSH